MPSTWNELLTESQSTNSINEYLNKQTYQFNKDYIENIRVDDVDLSIDMLGLALILKTGENKFKKLPLNNAVVV